MTSIFKDYYSILKLEYPSSLEEIHKAYKTESKRWHPDINIEHDTTVQMQNINEAYNILGDRRKKTLYDAEYRCFIKTPIQKSYNYKIRDEDLKTNIKDAQKQAKEFVDVFYQSLRSDSKVAINGAWEGMKGYIIGGIMVLVIFFCFQMCS